MSDVLLQERIGIGHAPNGRVDRENKLIKGVKILGFHSGNRGSVLGKDFADVSGYDYDPQAIRDAIPLYEGAPVNLNHLESSSDRNGVRIPAERRKVEQRFGRLRNVRVEPDGAYADIHYLENHPLAPMVLEVAESMPDQLAMSHHAYGNPEKQMNGRALIKKINSVSSVDLTAEPPGTTTTLFESAPMPDDLTGPGTAPEQPGEPNLISNTQEDQPESPTMDEEPITESAAANPVDALCEKVKEIFTDEGMDDGGKIAAFKALVKVLGDLKTALGMNGEEEETGDEEGLEESCGAGGKMKESKMKESLQQSIDIAKGLQIKNTRLEEQLAGARFLLESKGIKAPEAILMALGTEKDDKGRVSLMESLASLGSKPAPKPTVSKPRSASPIDVQLQESRRSPTRQDSMKNILAAIRRN